jgi:CheY-like chemotaxis protein
MENIIAIVILFIIADLSIRFLLKNIKERKDREERNIALEQGLKLDFSEQAKTLKRVEVESPKARILCVDDEQVVLDSFRKILVLDGYSVDTVERGAEVANLIGINHYDFVFVDIKMPEMDGVQVTQLIKEIRPDIDVIIITGYASVETAVATMKFGAMDYVQKPFTEDELLDFTKKCLLKRRERIKGELGPRIQLAQVSEYIDHREIDELTIPGGVFISPGHCWVSLNEDGTAKIGIDDFAKKMIGRIDSIEPPNIGRLIKTGESLLSLRQGKRSIPFKAPISGKIIKVNNNLNKNISDLDLSCYNSNWICMLDTSDEISTELQELKIGKSAVSFFKDELGNSQTHFDSIAEMRKRDKKLSGQNGFCFGKIDKLTDEEWRETIKKFFNK